MGEDYAKHLYGDLSFGGCHERSEKIWHKIAQLDENLNEQVVNVRARVYNSRVKGNLAFLVLRDHYYTVQCVASKNEQISKQMIQFLKGITNESIIDVEAKVTRPEQPIESCSQKVELQIVSCFVVNRSKALLPF